MAIQPRAAFCTSQVRLLIFLTETIEDFRGILFHVLQRGFIFPFASTLTFKGHVVQHEDADGLLETRQRVAKDVVPYLARVRQVSPMRQCMQERASG